MQDKSRRCDNCSAEAWVTLKKTDKLQELDFCAHDYNRHSTMLHAQGWVLANDERHLINKKPSVSV